MIEQEPFCGVRTHFYHDASSYDMFRDRRVVENRAPDSLEDCSGQWGRNSSSRASNFASIKLNSETTSLSHNFVFFGR